MPKKKTKKNPLTKEDKKTKQDLCTALTKGERHDFRLFKESKTKINPDINIITDRGYPGIQKLHSKSELPKKEEQEKTFDKRR